MEHLEEYLDDWLTEELNNYMDDDYLVFDCPGQIELFSHVPVLKSFVAHLQRKNFNICAVYLLDLQFITDVTKFISGCMASLSAMVQLELPHVNIPSKMDLVRNKRDVEEYMNPQPQFLLSELNQRMAPQIQKLNKSLAELVDEYSMVSFVPLDLRKETSCGIKKNNASAIVATGPSSRHNYPATSERFSCYPTTSKRTTIALASFFVLPNTANEPALVLATTTQQQPASNQQLEFQR